MSKPILVKELKVLHTQKALPFRPLSVLLNVNNNGSYEMVMDAFSTEQNHMLGILTDIIIVTIFEEEYTLENVEFLYFTQENPFHLISTPTPCNIPNRIVRTLYSVDVCIKKYILGGTLYTCDSPVELMDPFEMAELNDTDSTSVLFDQDKETESFLIDISALASSRKILDYALSFNESHQNMVAPALLELIESTARSERLYGNNKRETINKVQSYLKEHPLFE